MRRSGVGGGAPAAAGGGCAAAGWLDGAAGALPMRCRKDPNIPRGWSGSFSFPCGRPGAGGSRLCTTGACGAASTMAASGSQLNSALNRSNTLFAPCSCFASLDGQCRSQVVRNPYSWRTRRGEHNGGVSARMGRRGKKR